MPDRFHLVTSYQPKGDQPEAIRQLVRGVRRGQAHQVLLGVTGSGKTFTVANVIVQMNLPTLILAPNKTLAAQLYGEFQEFFPGKRRRVFCQLLRLLSARGLRPPGGPLYRERLLHQRGHRPDAPFRHPLALRPQ